jgi:hypothetical protein
MNLSTQNKIKLSHQNIVDIEIVLYRKKLIDNLNFARIVKVKKMC